MLVARLLLLRPDSWNIPDLFSASLPSVPGSFSEVCSTKWLVLSENGMSEAQQMTQMGAWQRSPPVSPQLQDEGKTEAISGEILKAFGPMAVNFSGHTFPENMAGVPFASGKATSSGLSGP